MLIIQIKMMGTPIIFICFMLTSLDRKYIFYVFFLHICKIYRTFVRYFGLY